MLYFSKLFWRPIFTLTGLCVLCFGLVCFASVLWAANPEVGKTTEIPLSKLDKNVYGTDVAGFYEFKISYNQGDKFKFLIEPVASAKMNSVIHIYESHKNIPLPGVRSVGPQSALGTGFGGDSNGGFTGGVSGNFGGGTKSFESSPSGKRFEWIMKDGLPGESATVRIESDAVGKLKLTIIKVDPKLDIDALKEQLKQLEAQVQVIKSLIDKANKANMAGMP